MALTLASLSLVLFGLGLQEPEPRAETARSVVEKALPLLQTSGDLWIQRKNCTSCHHQALGSITAEIAREKGFAIQRGLLAKQEAALSRVLRNQRALNLQGHGPANGQFGESYSLLALSALGSPRTETTDVVMVYLADLQAPDGSFPSYSHRPPLEDSPVTATALNLKALFDYGLEPMRQLRIERAKQWLLAVQPRDTEEAVFRAWGLHWSGASDRDALAKLVAQQRDDGGWAQHAELPSDAYATGQVLSLLLQLGWSAQHPAIGQGVSFLLDTWSEDERAWRVPTRRRVEGLPYFESGFPFGEDQFISYAASAWATTALMLYLEPTPATALKTKRATVADPQQTELDPLFRAALWSDASAFEKALEDHDDPLAVEGPEGVPLLAAAARDARKVEHLLARGADPAGVSEHGRSALHVAALSPRSLRSLELLLAAGAPVDQADAEGATPLWLAASLGNLEGAKALLRAGASVDRRAPGRDGSTPLLPAVTRGDRAMVGLLLEAGANWTQGADAWGSTALHEAAYTGDLDLVQTFLEQGADPNSEDEDGRSALHYVAMQYFGDPSIGRVLRESGATSTLEDAHGQTPLSYAERDGFAALAEALRSKPRKP